VGGKVILFSFSSSHCETLLIFLFFMIVAFVTFSERTGKFRASPEISDQIVDDSSFRLQAALLLDLATLARLVVL